VAEYTIEQAKAAAEQVKSVFADGFQWTDLFKVVPMVMEIVEQVGGMSGPEKKATALKIIEHVIDTTDMPGPDSIFDPILKKAAPFLIEMVISATSGEVKVNQG
jgi:hypothetical protein